MTKSIEKSFLIDPLTTNNAIYRDLLTLTFQKQSTLFFHKISKKDDIPLKLPRLQMLQTIERTPSTRFLGVLLHENPLWIDHIKHTENKTSMKIGILNKARDYLS